MTDRRGTVDMLDRILELEQTLRTARGVIANLGVDSHIEYPILTHIDRVLAKRNYTEVVRQLGGDRLTSSSDSS